MSISETTDQTFRQKLYEAADADREVVDRLLARSTRGSDQIAGTNLPLSFYLADDPRDLPRVPIEDR